LELKFFNYFCINSPISEILQVSTVSCFYFPWTVRCRIVTSLPQLLLSWLCAAWEVSHWTDEALFETWAQPYTTTTKEPTAGFVIVTPEPTDPVTKCFLSLFESHSLSTSKSFFRNQVVFMWAVWFCSVNHVFWKLVDLPQLIRILSTSKLKILVRVVWNVRDFWSVQ